MLKIGKRYQCEGCGTVVLVTKPSDKTLSCCAGDMTMVAPKKTASAD